MPGDHDVFSLTNKLFSALESRGIYFFDKVEKEMLSLSYWPLYWRLRTEVDKELSLHRGAFKLVTTFFLEEILNLTVLKHHTLALVSAPGSSL